MHCRHQSPPPYSRFLGTLQALPQAHKPATALHRHLDLASFVRPLFACPVIFLSSQIETRRGCSELDSGSAACPALVSRDSHFKVAREQGRIRFGTFTPSAAYGPVHHVPQIFSSPSAAYGACCATLRYQCLPERTKCDVSAFLCVPTHRTCRTVYSAK